jgi:hypothetical protein
MTYRHARVNIREPPSCCDAIGIEIRRREPATSVYDDYRNSPIALACFARMIYEKTRAHISVEHPKYRIYDTSGMDLGRPK